MNQNQEKISSRDFIDVISNRTRGVECTGLSGSAGAYLAAKTYKALSAPMVVVQASAKEAETFVSDLTFFSGPSDIPVIYFPPYNILPSKILTYHTKTAARRIKSLYEMATRGGPFVVVTTVDAMLQKLIPRRELCDNAELVQINEEMDRDGLIDKLVSGGYVRAVIVEEPGDFSVRGGILDVFSPMYSNPIRIELFGDFVDSLRFFSAVTQRKMRDMDEAVILPARETILKPSMVDSVIHRIRRQAAVIGTPATSVRRLVERVKGERAFSVIESLMPLVYPRLDSFFDYTPNNALFLLAEPGKLEKRAGETRLQAMEHFETARDEKEVRVDPGSLYITWEEARGGLEKRNPVSFKAISLPDEKDEKDGTSMAPIRLEASMEDNSDLAAALKIKQDPERLLAPLAEWIRGNTANHFSTRMVCGSRPHGERLAAFLEPYGADPVIRDGFDGVGSDLSRRRADLDVCIGRVSSGFVWPAESLAMVTEDEIFGPGRRGRKRVRREIRTDLIDFSDLKTGDLVVHTEHGIGRYEGLTKLKLEGVGNDFILIVYKGEDKLYLPVDRLGMVQKYMGVDGFKPVLDKMGGNSWDKVKARVKKSAEKMAGELLKLYAARKVRKGFSFEEASDYFRDFEAGFPYEETPDQLGAIEAVLEDMAKPRPMDRLVCGDVGYGKTEVALRASFLAVNVGKQVAVLVPTTVLAEQHHATFSKRFEPYSVEVACLSRFRPPKEQRDIVKRMKSGHVDIVIGTHRLFQKDIGFKDLGLLVLDEEQRFGVKHKEKLKKIRSRVDVLALTATPIPRTLHLSLMGIRDISVISTPPEERRSIITYISEFDDATAAEAIRKEMARDGQVFFIHNNIHNIERMAGRLRSLVPGIRLDVAHGRLGEEELERVMLRFVNKEIDLLVCTTIVESGLDIPAANTILINRADRFGLSQIYQLRGRVGRSGEQAYAYLFIPRDSALGDNARKRLKVLMEYSDLGSGFQIAMSDLKIRGGGAILGASQSGHIAAVGYDMFLKLMEEAVAELKGEPVQEALEPEINLSMSAFIPASYISDIDQRMSAYKRLVKMNELKEIADFKAELLDRYGALPDEAGNLLLKIMLRAMAIKAGVSRLDLKGSQLILYFSEAHQSNPSALVDMVLSKGAGRRFTRDDALAIKLSNGAQMTLMARIKNILKEITEHVNP